LRPKEQNVASLDMKIGNWCIKQSMWIRVNKDDNYYKLKISIEKWWIRLF
jgi:hypothetical protein